MSAEPEKRYEWVCPACGTVDEFTDGDKNKHCSKCAFPSIKCSRAVIDSVSEAISSADYTPVVSKKKARKQE